MKVALPFFLIFFGGQALSCQYDLTHLDYLKINPERANLAAIVRVVKVQGKRIFTVEKAWTTFMKTYPLKDGDNCQVSAKENESYLLLSEITTFQAHSKKFKGFRQSGVLLIELKDATEMIKRLDQYKGTKLEIPDFVLD